MNREKESERGKVIPRPCRYVRNVGVWGERGDAWVEVEANSVLPEVVLVIKTVAELV